jgi:hypothetical protein
MLLLFISTLSKGVNMKKSKNIKKNKLRRMLVKFGLGITLATGSIIGITAVKEQQSNIDTVDEDENNISPERLTAESIYNDLANRYGKKLIQTSLANTAQQLTEDIIENGYINQMSNDFMLWLYGKDKQLLNSEEYQDILIQKGMNEIENYPVFHTCYIKNLNNELLKEEPEYTFHLYDYLNDSFSLNKVKNYEALNNAIYNALINTENISDFILP